MPEVLYQSNKSSLSPQHQYRTSTLLGYRWCWCRCQCVSLPQPPNFFAIRIRHPTSDIRHPPLTFDRSKTPKKEKKRCTFARFIAVLRTRYGIEADAPLKNCSICSLFLLVLHLLESNCATLTFAPLRSTSTLLYILALLTLYGTRAS